MSGLTVFDTGDVFEQSLYQVFESKEAEISNRHKEAANVKNQNRMITRHSLVITSVVM